MPRLLVFTRIWPTAEHPSVGIFVQNRLAGIAGVKVVVCRPARHWALGLLRFIVDGLKAGAAFDGIEAHVLYPAGFAALIVARLRRLPLVVLSHGTDAREYPRFGRGYRFFARQVVRRANLIVANSEETAAQLRVIANEAGARNADIRVIAPGYDAATFRTSPRRADARGRVLYLGGTNPRKGYDVAQGLADTLVGPGLGEVAPQEAARLMAEHDVVLMPSRAEPFGLVAAEAIGSGRWVVAGDVGGLRDIVTDGVNGTLVGDGDYAGALARIPDYDPETLARSVERYRVGRWQEELAAAWDWVLSQRKRERRR